jgi:beta-glucuronidase
LVDEFRQRRPSYFVWKGMNSPASLEGHWQSGTGAPTRFTATIQANSIDRLPSFPLHDYRLEWEVRDDDNKVIASGAQMLPDLASAQTIAGNVQPLAKTAGLRLHLTLLSPTGSVAVENNVEWRRSEVGSKPVPSSIPLSSVNAGGTPAPAQ